MKIKLNLDTVGYKSKPVDHYGAIRNRLYTPARTVEITPEDLATAVEQGKTFTPAVMEETTRNGWRQQQVLVVDFDNDTENPLQPEESLQVAKRYDLQPYFMYYTFSSTPERPKYRHIYVLSEPITDSTTAADLGQRLTNIFNTARPGSADKNSGQIDRMFAGSKKFSLFDPKLSVTDISKLQALPEIKKPLPRDYKPPKAITGGRLADLEAQVEGAIDSFDLAGHVETTTASRPVRRGNKIYYNPCPVCGHNDCFNITGNLYCCFSDNHPGGTPEKPAGGTIIQFLQEIHGMDYGQARDMFKYEILRQDPEDWKKAYIEEQERKKEMQAPKKEPEAPAGETLPGLLTYEAAVEVFQTEQAECLDFRSFPCFGKTAKIKTHDSVVIAADTGAGKSSLAINFINDLNDTYPALYINLEMDALTVLRRLVAIRSGIELDAIEGYKNDEKTAEVVNATLRGITSRKPLQILQNAYSLEEIEEAIKTATQGREVPTMVIIDHSLLITTKASNGGRYERFTHVSEQLRRISRTYNIILFILLQQSREGKKDENERPKNYSLKESGSWENDATQIIFLWHDPAASRKKLLLTKNRNGEQGEFLLEYFPHTQTYRESKTTVYQLNPANRTRPKTTPRDKNRDRLQAAYSEALIKTNGLPTLRALADAAGVKVATVKGWLKEYGGTINGQQIDPAGINDLVEYSGFVRVDLSGEQIPPGFSGSSEPRPRY